jgi:hypothetical protein
MKIKYILTIISLLFAITDGQTANITWVGSTSNAWNTGSNWSSGTVPDSADNVTISSGTYSPVLDQNRKVSNLTLSTKTIDLNGYSLTIYGTATMTSGTVTNGTFFARGNLASFNGTLMDCPVDAVCGYIRLSGSTFNETADFTDQGAATGTGSGGCTFNDDVTITHTGTLTYFTLASTTGDTFNGNVTFTNMSNREIHIASNGTTQFNGNIILNSTSTGGISFGSGGGSSTLASGKTISIGTSGFTADFLTLKNFTQNGSTAQAITLTSTAVINMISATFNGNLTVTAPGILLKNSTFNGSATLTRNGSSGNHQSDGGNTFHTLTLDNAGSSGRLRWATTTPDIYNGNATFNSTGGQDVQIAYSGDNLFAGNITINSNKVVFNTSTGKVTFTGGNAQTLNGSYNFPFKKLAINKSANQVTANTTLSVDDTLFFVSKNLITTSTNLLTMKAGSVASGASNSSFVNGPVKKIGNTAFNFPVGDNGIYRKLGISAPSNSTHAFQVYYSDQEINQNRTSRDTTLALINGTGYWDVQRVSGNSNVKIITSWNELRGIADSTRVRITRWNGTKWINVGGSNISGTYANGTLETDSLQSTFGKYTFSFSPTAFTVCTTPTNSPNDYFNFDNIISFGNEISGQSSLTGLAAVSSNIINSEGVPSGGSCFSSTPIEDDALALNSGILVDPSEQYFAIEMNFRLDENFINQSYCEFFNVSGYINANLTYEAFKFECSYTSLSATPQYKNIVLNVPFTGIGKKSIEYYNDNQWHHIVFVHKVEEINTVDCFVLQIWIDGELLESFQQITTKDSYNLDLSTASGQPLYFKRNNAYVQFTGELDQIALYYTQELCDANILLHANLGQIYDFTADTDPISIVQNNLNGSFDENDYPLGFIPDNTPVRYEDRVDYINFNYFNANYMDRLDAFLDDYSSQYTSIHEPIEQLSRFPLPRYLSGHTFRANVHWIGSDYLGYRGYPGNGSEDILISQQVIKSTVIQAELAKKWNYTFSIIENTSTIGETREDLHHQDWINWANSNNDPDIKFSIRSYRKSFDGGIANQSFSPPENYYLVNSSELPALQFINYVGDVVVDVANGKKWNPANSVSFYNSDYTDQLMMFDKIFGYISHFSHPLNSNIDIYFLGENNEIVDPFVVDASTGVPLAAAFDDRMDDLCTTGCTTASEWQNYLGDRKSELDNTYRDQCINYLISNSKKDPKFMFLNYAVDDHPNPDFRYPYAQMRTTQSMAYNDGVDHYYSSTDIYPRRPFNWHKGISAFHGFDWLLQVRQREIGIYNDKRFAPFVTAGYEQAEELNIRPGQWLGLTKAIGMTGVDYFNPSYFNLTADWFSNPKGYVWQTVIPSYTQAVFSKVEEFFTTGDALVGDVVLDPTAATPVNSYRIKGNSPNDLIMARKLGTNKYLITGSVQTISNSANSSPLSKNVGINVDGIPIEINIRRQGSTYYFENSNPPVFYQLDEWHEYKHPERWTKDFHIEAELFENTSSGTIASTDLSHANLTDDFTSFVSFVNGGTGVEYEYTFEPRESVSHDFYFQIRVRSNDDSSPADCLIELFEPGNATPVYSASLGCNEDENWNWYNVASVGTQFVFGGLTNQQYTLKISNVSDNLLIDKFIVSYNASPDETRPDGQILSTNCTTINIPFSYVIEEPSCHGLSDGTITFSPAMAGSQLYSIDNGTTFQANNVFTGLEAGPYVLVFDDGTNISPAITVSMGEPDELQVHLSQTTISCHGDDDGKLNTAVVGGVPAYSYAWSSGSLTNDYLYNLAANIYSVTVTDANGCTATDSETLIDPDQISITTVNITNNTDCAGNGEIEIIATGGTGNLSYSINGTNGNYSNTFTFTDLFGDTYDVAVKDQHGCIVSQPEIVGGAAQLVIDVTPVTPMLCSGDNNGAIDISVSGGEPTYTYLWNTAATTQDISGLTPGTYTVTVTDDNSCTATESILINSTFTSPTANAGTDVAICAGQSTTLTATPSGVTYLWNNSQTTASITVSTSGTYTVTVTEANGCKDTDDVIVTVNSLPSATITPSGPLSFCDGGSVSLSAPTGMTNYLWNTLATTQSINATASGTYTVTVSDGTGCANSSNVAVTVLPVPIASITPPNVSFCAGLTETFTATTASSYLWNTGATTQSIPISSAGTFTVTITSVNNCTSSASANSAVFTLPTADAGTDPTICLLGSATLTATGGVTYLWSTSETSAGISVDPLVTTAYTVTVTNGNGCTDTDDVTVNVNQSCCGDPTNNLINSVGAIPANTYTGTKNLNYDANVNGAVIFDDLDLLIASGITITINNGGHLTITNGSVLKACGEMWQGIIIEDGGELTIEDGSIIEDAEIAVDAQSGSQFNIDDAEFQRNFIGIHASDGDFSSSSVENTTFGCLNTSGTAQAYSLKEPHASPAERSRFHIHLEDVTNFNIGSVGNSNNFAGADNGVFGRFCHQITLEDNNFDDFTENTNTGLVRTGIAARFEGFDPISLPQNASLRVIGGLIIFDTNNFTDCEGGIAVYNEGFEAQHNVMTNVNFGIVGQWPNSLTHVTIFDNDINGTQIGVDMRAIGWTNVTIEENEISVITPPTNEVAAAIRVLEPVRSFRSSQGNLKILNNDPINTLGTHGILIENIQRARISGNVINMNHTSLSELVYGIEVVNGNQNLLCENIVSGDDFANMEFKHAISVVESPRTAVECNEINNSQRSIEYRNTCPDSRIRANTLNYNDFGIVLADLGVIGPQTEFEDPGTYPANEYVGDGSFNFNTAALGSFDSDAAQNPFWIGGTDPFVPYGTVDNGGGATSFAPIDPSNTEYVCPACNTVIFPELIDMDFADKIAGDSMTFDANEELMRWKLKYSLFDQLARDTSTITLLHFDDFIDSVSTTNLMEFYSTFELINLTTDSTYFSDSTTVHTMLDGAITINDGITTSEDFESYLQYINSIYFLLVSNYNYQLSNEEYEIVINIANRCPYVDGQAVYHARAILSMQGDKYYYNDSDLCAEESRIGNANQQPSDQLILYPVPAQNELHIKTGKDIIERIEIFNHLGQVIHNSTNDKNSGQMTIPLFSYSPGIYQIRVKVRSGKHYNEKFVIIK